MDGQVDAGSDTDRVTNPPQLPPYRPLPVYVVPQQPPRSWMAAASLTCGIVGMLTFICTLGIPSALAVILGHAARSETKRGAKSGHHNATAGLALGYLVVIPLIVVVILDRAGIKP
jgi:hypothetical protein